MAAGVDSRHVAVFEVRYGDRLKDDRCIEPVCAMLLRGEKRSHQRALTV